MSTPQHFVSVIWRRSRVLGYAVMREPAGPGEPETIREFKLDHRIEDCATIALHLANTLRDDLNAGII